MNLSKTLPSLSCLVLAMAACSAAPQNADATDAAVAPAAESAAASAPAAPPADVADEAPAAEAADVADVMEAVGETHRNTIAMAGVMTAMVESCGLGNASQSREALANLQREMAGQGLSAAQVAAVFNAAYEEGKAKAAQADPARRQRDCASLRQMADPETVKQIERASAEAEAALKQMQR